jgi:alpha-tubulin suppressor-like RCC1 family protein
MARGSKREALHARATLRARLRLATVAMTLLAVLLALCATTAVARPSGSGGASPFVDPPKVTRNPANQSVLEGQSASFTSTATGSPAIRWQVSANGGAAWTTIEGATSTTYAIASTVASENGDQFRAVFTNAGGETISKTATLTVERSPSITLQPKGVSTTEGHAATFEAAASGTPTPTVQWQSSTNAGSTWKAISGATTTSYTINSVKTSESGIELRAVFKNSAGEAITEPATLTVTAAPKVTKEPTSSTVFQGESASFEAAATGAPTPAVQWEVSTDGGGAWASIAEATHDQLVISDALASESGYQYRAVFTNSDGTATSSVATLTVQAVPVITEQPQSATVLTGANATFEAAAEGAPAPTVSWEVSTNSGSSWSAVAGAEQDRLTVADASAGESGYEYRAVFTNTAGKTDSSPAVLTVSSTDYSGYGWGLNSHGQVGIGSSASEIDQPEPIHGLQFITAIAGGMRHSLALLADGSVYAWGFNGFGQLGDEGAAAARSPILVEHLSGVKAIAAGGEHSLALLDNGTAMAWGDDESGQLGDDRTINSEVPVAVKGLTGVVALSAGEEDSLALRENGTVMAWGNNEEGQLGTGSVHSSSVPVEVKGLKDVKAIAAGGQFSMALLDDGTVEAWGDDSYDQLGNAGVLGNEPGEEENLHSTVPVAVEGLADVTSIAAGRTHALALVQGGTVDAWGADAEGELGNAQTEPASDVPAAVSGLTHAIAVSAGYEESVALLEGGELMSWGADNYGTLGDGTQGEGSDVPVAVRGIGGAVGVAAGGSQMLAFGEALPTVTRIEPSEGPLAGGTTVTITGTDLGSATAVQFGSKEATSFKVDSQTSVTAVAPEGSGTVNVVVTTEAGATPIATADRFSYRPAPTVTKLSVKSGPASGHTTVTITGTEFTGASAVDFGGVEAIEHTVNSSTSITAVTPENTSGEVYVTVAATGGTSATGTRNRFKYTPAITSLMPDGGPLAGGTVVSVSGAGFAAGTGTTKFKFGKAASRHVECESETSCRVTVPAASSAGTVTVEASANKANSVAEAGDQYTYE